MPTDVRRLEGVFVTVPGGRRVWVEQGGEGTTVVLSHGGVADRRMWDEQVAALIDRYHVIRYDHAGYGRSEPAREPYSYVDELDAVLDHAAAERAVLVGCSMGGRVVIDYTLAHPERVRALVAAAAVVSGEPPRDGLPGWDELVAALKSGDAQAITTEVMRIWAPLRTVPDVDARIRHLVADNVTGIASMGSSWLPGPPAYGRLDTIAVPTLVVVGDRDQTDHVRTAEMLARQIPGARLEVLSGVDHNIPVRAGIEFTELLAGFLTAHQTEGRP